MGIAIALPIGIATVLAVPIHLSIDNEQVHVGHYASLSEDHFPLAKATRAVLSDGVIYRDGTFHPQKDLVLFFEDGTSLRASAVADGGTDADPRAVEVLLNLTGRVPEHVRTSDSR